MIISCLYVSILTLCEERLKQVKWKCADIFFQLMMIVFRLNNGSPLWAYSISLWRINRASKSNKVYGREIFQKIQIFIICPKILLQWVHAVTSVATRSKLSVSMCSPRCMPRACPTVHVWSRAVWWSVVSSDAWRVSPLSLVPGDGCTSMLEVGWGPIEES